MKLFTPLRASEMDLLVNAKIYCRSFITVITLFISTLPLLHISTAQAQVSGTVFRDFNANGTYQGIPASGTYAYGEPPVAGIRVVATTAGGSFSTTSAANGAYSFSSAQLPTGTPVRLEFSGIATANLDFNSGQLASGGASTSVQFVTAGTSTTADFGVNYPRDYCQAADQTRIITSCFNANGTTNDAAIISFSPTEISDPAQPFVNGTTTSTNQFAQTPLMAETSLATQAQVGTVNGFAYYRRSRTLLIAAFARFGSPIGPGGLGAIYAGTLASPTATALSSGALLATVPNAGTGTGTNGAVAQAQVGKIGLGTIALSDDENTLYVINLNTRSLVSIPLSGAPGSGTPVAGTQTSVAIPAPTDCQADYRPFAVRVHRGKIYIGVTCGSGTEANLKGYVYEYDGTTFKLVLTIPFTYPRADDATDANPNDANYYGFGTAGTYIRNNLGWVNWNTYPDLTAGPGSLATINTTGSAPVAKSQPWLTDIAFDGEDMILGVRSRLADAVNNSFWVVGGDILRACSTTPGTWTLENNGTCGGVTPALPTTDPYTGTQRIVGNSRGPGGREYYWGDDGFEGEASQGSLLQIPGSPNVITSQVDAIGHQGQVGVMAVSNSAGRIVAAGNVFYGFTIGGGSANNIGKSNGLGAMDITCNAAPIEIGNRLWIDTNKNGIQDPTESPLAGVTVQLFAANGTTPIATTITNGNGLYTFSSASTAALTYNTAYQLRIPTGQSALANYAFTAPNQGANRQIDSDFTPGATFAVASFTTGGPGQNDFSFDAGVACPLSATTTASTNAVCQGQSVVLTTQVSPAGAYTYTTGAPTGVSLTGANTATVTASNLPTGVNNFTVTVSSGPTCFTTNIVSVTVSNSLLTLSASQSAICLGQSVNLSLLGIVPLGGIVSFGTQGPLGAILNPVSTSVFSPTATTTFVASVRVPGTLITPEINLSSCPVTVTVNQPPPTVPAVSVSLCAGTRLSPATISSLPGLGSLSVLTGLTGATNILTGPTTVSAGVNSLSLVTTNLLGCSAVTPISVTGVALPSVAPISLSLCAGATISLPSLLSSVPSLSVLTGLPGVTNLLTGPTTVSAGVNSLSLITTNLLGCSAVTPISVTGVALPSVAPISLSLCAGATVSLPSLLSSVPSLSVLTGSTRGD